MLLYLLATVLLVIAVLSIAWTSFIGAPWVPTRISTVGKMLKMAEVKPEDVVYDLGCGDARILLTAVRRFNARAVGIEIDPLRYFWSKFIIWLFGHQSRTSIIFGDFFKQDLSEADVVTCYLLQETNEKLESKLLKELRPGTRVVSHSFTFPRMHLTASDLQDKIYCYRIIE